MNTETRLDSAVFQLTPTRTRCDLFIAVNGKMEKMASGLLNPFLAHLKTAQEQIKKGGYSITLKPDPGRDTVWFTKGTVERFVRFVSTPEVLERVNTLEFEIIQIEKAIAIQSNEILGPNHVEDQQARSTANIEDSKSILDSDADQALVLYKPGEHPPVSNGATSQEETSKVKLLRVQETRKIVLQKEQGMAFARAKAAGFDVDNLTCLVSFSECFGATRLRDACFRFLELWKEKHESGQWLEIEAAEAMSTRSEFSSVNATGIVFSSDPRSQKEWTASDGILGSKGNGPGSEMNFIPEDRRPPTEQGQYQHPMFPQWPMHSPQGAPVFQAYPMQGMPYYPGGGPYFQSPYPPPMEDPRFNTHKRMGKRHSMDSNIESDTNSRSPDDADQMSEVEKEVLQGLESHRKAGRSGKKKSGVVVIRNINYITSKRRDTSGSESQSASDSETDEVDEEIPSDSHKKHKRNSRRSKNKGAHDKSEVNMNSYNGDEMVYGREADSGSWQAFQNFLLNDEEQRASSADGGMFFAEKEAPVKKRHDTMEPDPILPPDRDFVDPSDQRIAEFDTMNGKAFRSSKQNASDNEVATSHDHFSGREYIGDTTQDVQFSESEGGRGVCRRASNDDFLIYGRESQTIDTNSYLDPLAGNEYVCVENNDKNNDKKSSQDVGDESFIVPFRSSSQEQTGTESRTAVDMDSEFSSYINKTVDSSSKVTNPVDYEPDELSFMPERDVERESFGYDPAMEYDTWVHSEDAIQVNKNQEDVSSNAKETSKNLEKEKKSKALQTGLDKRRTEATLRKGKPSKLIPQAEAQARAAKLRAYKADLQKEKKEREEEAIKRLESLKIERQKRIAARGSSSPASPLPSQLAKPRTLTKLSPGLHGGSKFTDSDPKSSPQQKLPIRTTSTASTDAEKTTKPSRPGGSSFTGSALSHSVSSLPDLTKERNGSTAEAKAQPVKNRRLSDPKGNNVHHASSLKPATSHKEPKHDVSTDEPQIKKISAIVSLDKTKSETLPELKIRTPRASPDKVPNKLATEEAIPKENGSRSPLTSENVSKKADAITQYSNGDDNTVIEKTVVMLEQEAVAPPIVQASAETEELRKGLRSKPAGEMSQMDSENPSKRVPPSPGTIGELEDISEGQLNLKTEPYEVPLDSTKEESKLLSTNVSEKPYQAPYARVSSVEESHSSNTQYNEGQQTTSVASVDTAETIKVHVSFSPEPELIAEASPEAPDKHKSKDSSKGFRRLLKFGKKSHNSINGEYGIETEVTEDQTPVSASSEEVNTLKNLISQDESQLGGTSTKVSRPFSLLSPFRSKTSEKKIAMA